MRSSEEAERQARCAELDSAGKRKLLEHQLCAEELCKEDSACRQWGVTPAMASLGENSEFQGERAPPVCHPDRRGLPLIPATHPGVFHFGAF